MPCFFKKMGWQSLLHGKMNLNIIVLLSFSRSPVFISMPLHHYVCGDLGSTILQALCCILSVLVGLKEKERKPAWLQQKIKFWRDFQIPNWVRYP